MIWWEDDYFDIIVKLSLIALPCGITVMTSCTLVLFSQPQGRKLVCWGSCGIFLQLISLEISLFSPLYRPLFKSALIICDWNSFWLTMHWTSILPWLNIPSGRVHRDLMIFSWQPIAGGFFVMFRSAGSMDLYSTLSYSVVATLSYVVLLHYSVPMCLSSGYFLYLSFTDDHDVCLLFLLYILCYISLFWCSSWKACFCYIVPTNFWHIWFVLAS